MAIFNRYGYPYSFDIPFSLGSKGANFFECPNQMIEGMELEMPKPDVSIKIEAFKMFQCG